MWASYNPFTMPLGVRARLRLCVRQCIGTLVCEAIGHPHQRSAQSWCKQRAYVHHTSTSIGVLSHSSVDVRSNLWLLLRPVRTSMSISMKLSHVLMHVLTKWRRYMFFIMGWECQCLFAAIKTFFAVSNGNATVDSIRWFIRFYSIGFGSNMKISNDIHQSLTQNVGRWWWISLVVVMVLFTVISFTHHIALITAPPSRS